MMKISEVIEIYRKEMENLELNILPKNFYKEIKKEIEEREHNKINLNMYELKELEQFKSLIKAIIERRKEKIVIHLVLKREDIEEVRLTEEERELVKAIKEALNLPLSLLHDVVGDHEIKDVQETVLSTQTHEQPREEVKTQESTQEQIHEHQEQEQHIVLEEGDTLEHLYVKAEEDDEDNVNVLITVDIEPYRGMDGKVYGPFKKGTYVKLPKEEADWLIQNRMAKLGVKT